MTPPSAPKPDRSGLWMVLALWLAAVAVVAVQGLEVPDAPLKRQVGHWVALAWACIGWLPALIFLRRGGKGGP